jgi:hemoglobin
MRMYEAKNSKDDASLFLRVGGEPFFVDLVERFYQRVVEDDVLRPLYPDDLNPGKANLAAFFSQYWGGPSTYSDTRGHPRLRMRHVSFSIGMEERNAWVNHMQEAVSESNITDQDKVLLIEYFAMAASSLINR